MKTSIKIIILAVALAALPACSAQKRAQRHIRRAVELCPELVQLKAHPIDTFLSVPGYTDITRVPMVRIFEEDSVAVKTEHGTIILSTNPSDSTLSVAFQADHQEVHYTDTIRYADVTTIKTKTRRGGSWIEIAVWLFGVIVGIDLAFCMVRKKKNR